MRIQRACRMALLGAAFAVAAAHATMVPADPQSAPAAATELVFAGDADYPPFSFVNRAGISDGFDVALFRALARKQGLVVDVRLGDWRDAVRGLSAGDVDVVPMLVTAERRRNYTFSRPFLNRYHMVFGRRGTPYISSLDELVGRRVAVQHDSVASQALGHLGRVVQLVPGATEGEAIEAVHDGHADLALVPIEIGYGAILEQGYDDVVAISPPLLEYDYAFAVARGRTALLEQINEGLAALYSDGTRDELYLAWLGNLTPNSATHVRWLSMMLIGLAALFALALALWMRAHRRALAHSGLAARALRSREDAEARADRLANHDAGTGLPNLHVLLDRMQVAVEARQQFALVRIDVLRLNLTQATAGSRFTGDLLRALAERLREVVPHGMVAVLGRGLFAVLVERVIGREEALRATRELLDAAQRPVRINDLTLQHRCRAGFACFPHDGRDADGMLRAAETACSAAHEQATAVMAYAEPLEPDPRNLTLLADLAEAVSSGALGHALQPVFDLATGDFRGAELLLRWKHPQRGELPPDLFVPLAEKTGAIGELTLYCLRAARREWMYWRERGVTLPISVNISGSDLANELLIRRIVKLCSDIGSSLTLEITETEMIHGPGRALAAVAHLRDAGVRISLDDFGTGYSSLSMLQQLAPEELKIDRSFIAGLPDSAGDQAIVRACIALAHEVGAVVIAEGVERAEARDWLLAQGCDLVQGFLYAAPMNPQELFSRFAGVADA